MAKTEQTDVDRLTEQRDELREQMAQLRREWDDLRERREAVKRQADDIEQQLIEARQAAGYATTEPFEPDEPVRVEAQAAEMKAGGRRG
jgi:uncharacterized coiled-coil DUF342 family protein